jgi:predicted dehydrogenase
MTDLLEVVVEKPFTVNTAEADRVIAIAKQSGKILTVFQSMPLLSILTPT